ncbi:MAG: VWA domain-containing protein [Parcubacteria group bacterium]|jgi:Ca-activated chloride channel family protein
MSNRGQGAGMVWLGLAGIALVVMLGIVTYISMSKDQKAAQAPQDQTAKQQDVTEKKPPVIPGTVQISIASSNTKEDWLHQMTDKFNSLSKSDAVYQLNGQPIRVAIIQETIDEKKKDYRSGAMVNDILNKKIEPTIASPGEESWMDKLNKEWQIQNGSAISKADAPILVRTPLVIAMWQSRATAMKAWPDAGAEAKWSAFRALANNPKGWEKYGHPEWGKFKIGYGYFGESNSGTLATVAMCTVGSGKKRLEFSEISPDSPAAKFLGDIEKSKVHSGKSDLWLLEKMIKGGQEYLDAVVTYESNVIMMNHKFEKDLRELLVCVYPQDGAVMVGHPFAILDRAPWVTLDQAQAAKIYQDFLLAKEQQEQVLAAGLRPADASVKLAYPFDASLGVNPNAKIVELALPDQMVIDRVGEVWHKVKKHTVVALIFDKSGSMSGSSLNNAKKGATEFVNKMDPEDIIAWMPFDSKSYGVLIEGTKQLIGEKLISEHIVGLGSGGNTALYDTILEAHKNLTDMRKKHGDSFRYGIVVLTDGGDNSSKNSLTDVEVQLQPMESDPTGIQIFTIGIGEAKEMVLRTIAAKGNGKFYKGTPEELQKIYAEIATYY